jgi:hypothetical protein
MLGSGVSLEEVGHWGHDFEEYILSLAPSCFLSFYRYLFLSLPFLAIMGEHLCFNTPLMFCLTTGPETMKQPTMD